MTWQCGITLTALGLAAISSLAPGAKACTNILVTPGATSDGSAIIAYNADSGNLMGMLYHYPASQNNTKDTMRKVYEWDTGLYLGEIPEAISTYNVAGNANEKGLVIAETTFGGVAILGADHQPNAIIDYGSLIYITLQRAATARGAIQVMSDLMDQYGYASEGETFSIADPTTKEVWIMEVIGRGDTGRPGAAWVARRVPDGYVAAHANQARIQTFPRDDPDNCLYSNDVVDLAVAVGLYNRTVLPDGSLDDTDFSFSDVYDPVTFSGARGCDARVWSLFSPIADSVYSKNGTSVSFEDAYVDYAMGHDLTNRMPLWVKPRAPLNLQDVMDHMANHYENMALDSRNDVGAGEFQSPYRPRPLGWKYQDKIYCNERSVATQQTGWSFVGHIRPWLPPELSSILWFTVDDSATAPRYPVYGSSQRVSDAYAGAGPQDGVKSPILEFDISKAFWVQNMVSNLAYTRWRDIYPLVQKRIDTMHKNFQLAVEATDVAAKLLYQKSGAEVAVKFLTDFSVLSGDGTHKEWMKFYGELFARYRDFYDIVPSESDPGCGCRTRETGMPDEWKRRIVEETGSHYEVVDDSGSGDHSDVDIDDDDDDDDDAFFRDGRRGSPFQSSRGRMENDEQKGTAHSRDVDVALDFQGRPVLVRNKLALKSFQ